MLPMGRLIATLRTLGVLDRGAEASCELFRQGFADALGAVLVGCAMHFSTAIAGRDHIGGGGCEGLSFHRSGAGGLARRQVTPGVLHRDRAPMKNCTSLRAALRRKDA